VSSTTRAEAGLPDAVDLAGPVARPWWRRERWLLAACLILAALSLLAPWALAYDPDAWVVWGRELTRLELDTSAGPSWKPLPVVFTTPFALTGDAAPALWLIVARAGGLLALAGAARLAWRLGGTVAAVAAVGAMALGPWWWFNTALGNSEGLLAAAALWAIDAHLDGRPRRAFLFGLAAALLRPEVWPFFALYVAWLWWERTDARPLIAGGLAAWAALWFGPDVVGNGGALQASDAARGVFSEESAGNADFPALAVLEDAVEMFTIPVVIAAAVALVWPARAAGPPVRPAGPVPTFATALWTHVRSASPVAWLAAGAVAWVVLVAVATQAGYAGNPRYLVPAAALAVVVAGVGVARLRSIPVLGPIVLLGAIAAIQSGDLRGQTDRLGERARTRDELARVIERAGGADRLRACAPVRTIASMRAPVAWQLDVPMSDIGGTSRPPAVLFRVRPYGDDALQPDLSTADRARFRLAAREPRWELWTACRP
jgi:hypothetical protein